jgi:3-dehydroquinate synthetase/adenylate kinase
MHPEHNLVLTGFMGTGKTTVGHALAAKLDMEFVDTDELIEARHGPISRIFAERGEGEFRAIERRVARELGQKTGLVIATGGRMILDSKNFQSLSQNGRIFCLVATPDEIHRRVINDETRRDRPLLQLEDPRERIIELMFERQHEYARFPQLITDHAGPDVIADEVAQLWSGYSTYDVSSPSGGYRYTVGAGILPLIRQLASIHGPIVVITDEGIRDLYAPSLGEVDLTIALPAGRSQKTLDAVAVAHQQLFEAGIDKSATVVSLGTSIIGDIASFAAATYLRGVDLVHCPTNLIAMVDTSVGAKIGLDVPQGRNLLGLYKQPKAVLADIGTLQTLPPRDFTSGMAEVVKHGLIASETLLGRIESTSWATTGNLVPGMLADLQSLVAEAIQIKIAIVEADPFEEKGQRTYLDLGHTFGYGIEYASGGEVNHGEAVAMGLVAATRLSHRKGHASADLVERVEALVGHIGLNPKIPASIQAQDILEGMRHDKEGRRSRLRFVLLRDVGEPLISDDVEDSEVLVLLDGMKESKEQAGVAAIGPT